jgi:hypothetical protein
LRGTRLGICGLSSLDVKPFDKLRAKQQPRTSIRPARLAPTTDKTYCKSHARPSAGARPRGKRRHSNQINLAAGIALFARKNLTCQIW